MADPVVTARPMQAREIVRRKRALAFWLTGWLVAIYVVFLGLVLGAPDAMGRDVAGSFTLGLLLGALAIVAGILLSWIYVAQVTRMQPDPRGETL